MTMLSSTAKMVSGTLGRNSWLVRSLRPAYESALDRIYKRDGMPWTINDSEYRISPYQRHRLNNEYERPMAEFLRTRIRSGQTCFDVGANIGVYVLQLANWSGPTGRVVAFEPNPAARAILEHHVGINGIADRVTIVSAAVGKSAGTATMYAALDADGMSRLNAPNQLIADRVQTQEVPVVTLDQYVQESGVIPDVLLVDIEGFEIAALEGAKRLIRENRELLIVVEMHPNVWSSANTTRQSAEALLDELQLTPVPMLGQADALDEHAGVHLQQRERA